MLQKSPSRFVETEDCCSSPRTAAINKAATKNTLIVQSQTANKQTSLVFVYSGTAMLWAQDCSQSLGSSQRNYIPYVDNLHSN